ncbi:unnamed protein product [Calypogeia fissa]
MAVPVLCSRALSSASTSTQSSYFPSSCGEHIGTECRVWRLCCSTTLRQEELRRHGLSAVMAETITEVAPMESPAGQSKQNPGRNRGNGGRRSPKVRNRNGVKTEMPSGGPKLEWLKQEGIDLTNECIIETDELCSRSANGLLELQRTIWRINRAIGQCSSVTEALGVIEEMKAAGLTTATEGTYLALITVCRRQKQGDRALSILQAMKQAGVKPGMVTYNTLISCCQQALRLEDAFRIKAEMEVAGIKPDVVTYTSLMALLVKASPYRGRTSPSERLEKVMDLYKEMKDKNIQPDAITFNTIMYAGAQAKLPGKVLEAYRTMISAGVAPNQFTFGILLESVGAGGRLKSALEVFNEMRAAGLAPQTSTYNYLIEACAAAPQPNAKKAWAFFEEMKKVEGVTPNAITFLNLIAASSKGGDHSGAMKAYELMLEMGLSEGKSSSTFNKLIHSASMAGGLESAFKIYDKMRGEGFKPDVVTYSTLLAACARADDLEKALAVGQDFEQIGIRPNQVVLHSLIAAFGKAGRWEDAITTFRSMSIGEEPPTAVSYSILFEACLGKDGVDAILNHKASDGVLQMSPGIEAAIQLYKEATAARLLKNYTMEDLSRCDVRNSTRAGTAVALLAWLEDIRKSPPATDLVVVVGTTRGKEQPKQGAKGKVSWKYSVAEGTLKSVGLQAERMSTITMQALTVRSKNLQTWISGSLLLNTVEVSGLEPSS